jgi:hypothetical protein
METLIYLKLFRILQIKLYTGADEIQCTELLNDYFLSQVNHQPTRANNFLDLVITIVPEKVQVDAILLPRESGVITDHNCLIFHVKATVIASVKLNRYVYDRYEIDSLIN